MIHPLITSHTQHVCYTLTLGLFFIGFILLTPACHDEWNLDHGYELHVEEGIPGELTLQLATASSAQRNIQSRSSEGEFSEQHLHSAYIFIIDRPTAENDSTQCRILARKYFSDILPYIKEITTSQNETLDVVTLQMPAVSSEHAQIYAIANLGYSDVQGVSNDAELLKKCDELTNLAELMDLSAQLTLSPQHEVNVERMQGHHLMSGFYSNYSQTDHIHFLAQPETVKLKATDGRILVYGANGIPYRPIDITHPNGTRSSIPAAIFVHRLDTKITFRIVPTGKFKDTPGAYFRLQSWQVLNAPTEGKIYWQKHPGKTFHTPVKNSKVFQRDISQGEDKSWEFTFYQLPNCICTHGGARPITAESIAKQYNSEHSLHGNQAVTPEQVQSKFESFSHFAYTLRELQQKKLPNHEPYNPDFSTDETNQTLVVQNGDYEYAPQNASMVRLVGRYYNPNEPARRRKDDPRNQQFPHHPLTTYPYWGENQQPESNPDKALKRTRSATVVYYVHLGYVGGGNFKLNTDPIPPTQPHTYADWEEKVNDFNVLRNHHYTYTLKIAGVENIKLEATREEQGNLLHQEKQPGAEGSVLESQHLYELDAHYETRNVVIDFSRMPSDYTQGFSFSLETPFETLRATLKQDEQDPNRFKIFNDETGQPIESIRGHDWDWIHFAWHGTEQDPYRSLINETTGNGISYSQTYGGYEHQQAYNEKNLTHDKDSEHPYKLLNSLEFTELVWRLFMDWQAHQRPMDKKTVTFTLFVDEFHYDKNPTNNAQVNWTDFCNCPKRRALFFMEPVETSADQNSVYVDAHLAISQQAIQTLYATDNQRGQVVADVAFGLEAYDEFRAKYAVNGFEQHPFGDGSSLNNGLFNIMNWYYLRPNEVIPWKDAENRFTDKCRAIEPDEQGNTENQPGGGGRSLRSGKWALYSRNRDLNRNGQLDPFEIRWFVPAIDQYTLCFLGGRPVFENPLFEKDKTVRPAKGPAHSWIWGVPVLHYISSSRAELNQIFWAEEGCSKGTYGDGGTQYLYGIRMARMLCSHGVEDTGQAFQGKLNENTLRQDAIFTVSQSPHGEPVDYNERTDGKSYYIVINKMNAHAFRDRVQVGDLAQHTHEKKENWLYRSYRIARHKIGYTYYENQDNYNRTIKIDGIPRTWWQVNGIWSDALNGIPQREQYYYRGPQHSLAYVYYENPDGSDLHHWRMPNLREAAIMSIAFPESWFGNQLITACTRSENLSSQSTQVPFWKIKHNQIARMGHDEPTYLYVRAIQDMK